MKKRVSGRFYFTHAGILFCVSSVKLSSISSTYSFALKNDFDNTTTGLSPPIPSSN